MDGLDLIMLTGTPICSLAGVDATDDSPIKPLPKDPADPNKASLYRLFRDRMDAMRQGIV